MANFPNFLRITPLLRWIYTAARRIFPQKFPIREHTCGPHVCVCALTYAHAASCMRAFLTRTCVHTCARILNARLTRARKLNMRARAF